MDKMDTKLWLQHLFFFTFHDEHDFIQVLYRAPWHFKKDVLYLQPILGLNIRRMLSAAGLWKFGPRRTFYLVI